MDNNYKMELLSYFGSEIFMTPLLKARSTMTNINCVNGVSNNDFLQNVQLISKEMFGFTCTIFYFVNENGYMKKEFWNNGC